MLKINSVATEFRKVSDLQMVETTKRAIRENVAVSHQMSKMSAKTMALLRENEGLRMKEKEMVRKLELMEASDKKVNYKNVCNLKVLYMYMYLYTCMYIVVHTYHVHVIYVKNKFVYLCCMFLHMYIHVHVYTM